MRNTIITIGKLRRKERPGAFVIFEPGYGIRIEGEDAPPEPAAAAEWVHKSGGWLRVHSMGRNTRIPEVVEFVGRARRRG